MKKIPYYYMNKSATDGCFWSYTDNNAISRTDVLICSKIEYKPYSNTDSEKESDTGVE